MTKEKINQIGIELLENTQQFCIDFPNSQKEILKERIDDVTKKLSKTVDAREIASLTSALDTLHKLYYGVHERSVIAFMAQYKPLLNLLESHPEESSDNSKTQDKNTQTNKQPQDSVDENLGLPNLDNLYKKYED